MVNTLGWYLLGVATLPAIVAVWFLSTCAWWLVVNLLESRFGISFEAHDHRDPDGISDYTLQKDVWFERSRGPIFTGHWYREPRDNEAVVTRWIGVGKTQGRSVVVYRKREVTQ